MMICGQVSPSFCNCSARNKEARSPHSATSTEALLFYYTKKVSVYHNIRDLSTALQKQWLYCDRKSKQTNLASRIVTTLFKLSLCLPLALSDMIFEIDVTIPMTSDLKIN